MLRGTVHRESGLVVVDKPAGLTSHDVVSRLRRILGTRKIGHAGTLDPMATGVLVCGVGRGTKLLGHLALDTKAYTATIRLGATTSTDDAEGEVVATGRPGRGDRRRDRRRDGRADRGHRAGAQLGERDQGRRAAGLRPGPGGGAGACCRPGRSPSRRSPCWPAAAPDLDVAVECSSGTYVRALARDLGAGARRRRAPHRAAPHPGRPVHPRSRPAPWSSWPRRRSCR